MNIISLTRVTSIPYISISHQSYANLIVILSLNLNMTLPYHTGNFSSSGFLSA